MHPSHPTFRRALARGLAIAFGALLLITCGEEAIAPKIPRIAQLSVEPIIPAGARAGGLVLDSVAIRVDRTDGSNVTRFSKRFPVDSAQLSLTSPQFLLAGVSEDFDVTVELFAGGVLLFSGTSRVSVGAAIGTPPVQVPVLYQGPGLQVASVQIQPRDTVLTAGAVVAFRVTALDSSAVPVTQFYVGWSSTAAAEIVDAAGTVTAPALRDTVFLRVQTPTGLSDSTRIFLMPQPSQLLKASGDNQSGGTGSPLAQPLAVEVRATDNLPVPGVTVTFSVTTGGGSVDSATATTDAQGIARSGATLGATVGAQTFTATAAGLPPVVFSATATSVAVPRTWNGSVSAAWTTAANWTPAGVPAAIDTVVIVAGTPNDPDLTGNASIAALTLQGTNAALFVTGNLTVAGSVSLPDTNSFIEFTTGQLTAGSVTIAGFQAFIDVSGSNAVVSGPVLVSGNSAFFQTGPGSALGATTLSGAAAFVEHAGGTQGPLTVSGASAFWEAGGAVTVTGTPAIQVTSTGFLGGFSTPVAVTVNGDVSIGGTGGFLTTRTADRWTINGNLQTTGGGYLVMTQPADTIEVNGNMTFGGGDETGHLTAGGLKVSGNFSQTGLATSFVGTGTHSVFLDGAGAQTLGFQDPGFSQSRFQNAIVANTAGGVQVTSDIYTTGLPGIVAGVPRILTGNGSTLFTTQLNVHNFTFDNLLLDFAGGTVVTFDSVTFQNYAATATPLRVTHPGSATALTFDHITFQVVPTTGFYLDATDSNPSDGVPLAIDVTNGAPAAGAPFIQTAGGAVVNWPPAAPIKTWTGAASTDWSSPLNWSPSGVPGAGDDVSIPAGPVNQPSLTANAAANSIIIAGLGARLTIAGHTFTVGSLVTHTDGLLVMTNAADLVVITGSAAFQGGDETGLLSAGELRIGGDFTQQDQTNTHSFFASGTHRTVMTGAALQTVTFCCTAAASGFQELDLSGTAGINIQFSGNGVFVYDTLISQVGAGAAPLLYTLGKSLTAARLRVDKLIVDRGTLILNEGGVAATEQLDNVTFQNFLTTFTQLQIVAPGGAGVPRTLTFNNLLFQPLTTGNTGKYLNVTAPSGTLIVDLPGASPAGGNGPTFTTTSGAVTVNWPAAAPFTWTGAVSTNWNTAGNWSGGAVPTNADDVIIPSGPVNQPVVSTSCSAKSLTVNPGATLNLGAVNCQVLGNVFADGVISGTGAIQISTAPAGVRGSLPSLIASSAVTATGPVTLTGSLTITSFTGTFDAGGQSVNVGGSLTVQSSGLLLMTLPADAVTVAGNASFSGGNELGFLTAGTLSIGGNLTQVGGGGGSNDSFHSSGTHLTVFTGASPTITFGTPGNVPGTSHFEQFRWTGAGTLTLGSDVFAHGFMDGSPGVVGTITSAGHTLQVGSLVSGGVIFNATALVLDQPLGGPITLSDVTFNGMSATVNQLTVNHPGTGGPFSFSNLTFANTPTTGFYLVANDVDGATNGVLTLDLVNPAPATSGGFSQVTGGAVINWPASAAKTWLGATQDWQTTTNWSPAGVPTASDDVIIGGAPNQPILSANATARDVTVAAGLLLNLNTFTLAVTGNVAAPVSTSIFGGTLQLNGAGKTITGNLSTSLSVTVNGTYGLAGRTTIGGLTVAGSGDLAMNGHTLVAGGALNTTGSGTITMTNPIDSVLVTGAGTFGGGDETGRLTAGYLKLGGSFGQTSVTSGASFAASGTHRTEMGAGAVRIINFATPGSGAGTSHFNDFIVNGAAGGISLAANTFVNGQLISHPTGATPVIGVVAAVKVLTVGGVDVSALSVDQNVMTIGAGTITQFDNVAFTGQANGITQLTIANPGSATPVTFTGVSFGVVPTTGLYLAANDIDGASPNALTINLAGASPAAPSPSLFSASNGAVINWPFNANLHTWTAAVDNSWENPLNWTNGGGPGVTGDAVIPAGPPTPVVGSNHQINSLTVQPGAAVNLNGHTLTMNNGVDAQSGIVSSGVAGGFIGTFFGPIRGDFVNVSVEIGLGGSAAPLNGLVNITGAGNTVFISGDVTMAGNGINNPLGVVKTTNGAGRLIMTNAGDLVQADSMDWSGGDQTGLLTAGVIQTRSLSQGFGAGSATTSFFGSGNHAVVLSGSTPSTIALANPGSSRFQSLDVTNVAGTLTLVNSITVAGQLVSGPPAAPPTITTVGGATLSAGGAAVSGLVFDGVPLFLSGGTIGGFDNVTFTNQSPVGTAFTVNNVGQGTPFTFSNLTFTTSLTAGGFHLVANDLDGASPDALVIDVIGTTPASGAGVSQANNGAVIHWPPTGSLFTWTGSANTDWSNPANWDLGAVPGVLDDVVVVPITNQPILSASGGIHSLTIQTGATLDVDTTILVIGGDLANDGNLTGVVGTGGVTLVGTGGAARGAIGVDVVIPGSYTLNGVLTVQSLSIAGASGSLILNGNQVITTAGFSTLNNGVVNMTSANDQLSVGTDALFAGGNETGRLTAGFLQIGGDFSQFNLSSAASFVASGTMLTQLNGLNPTVTFTDPGTSHFQDLTWGGIGGTLNMGGDITVLGTYNSPDGTSNMAGNGHAFTAAVFFSNGLNVDNMPIILDQQAGGSMNLFGITFTNMPTTATQITIRSPGQAGGVTFSSMVFSPLTTGDTGFYIDAVDTDGASPDILTITVDHDPSPAGGPTRGAAHTNTDAVSVVNWQP